MTSSGISNFERFLQCSTPHVAIHYDIQTIGSSSSYSSVASGAKEEEVRKPYIALKDIWSAFEDWTGYGVGVPLSLDDENNSEVTQQHYVPSLSAIQIFTIKPFADDSSSSRSSSKGIDGTGTGSADNLGYLYFQYNEITRPFERMPLTDYVTELAEHNTGLFSLKSSDLSPNSWISVLWSPIYPIPPVGNKKEIYASFLTYHSLTPCFPETIGKDDKGNEEQGVSSTKTVELRPFGAVTYKAFGNMWIMPGTLDVQKREMHEESASSWLKTRGFFHSDFNFFMCPKFYGAP